MATLRIKTNPGETFRDVVVEEGEATKSHSIEVTIDLEKAIFLTQHEDTSRPMSKGEFMNALHNAVHNVTEYVRNRKWPIILDKVVDAKEQENVPSKV